jgi:hypothetical protein
VYLSSALLLGMFHPEIHQSTIYYAGLLGRWEK